MVIHLNLVLSLTIYIYTHACLGEFCLLRRYHTFNYFYRERKFLFYKTQSPKTNLFFLKLNLLSVSSFYSSL